MRKTRRKILSSSNPFGFIKNAKEDLELSAEEKSELEEAVDKYNTIVENLKKIEDLNKLTRKTKQEFEREIIPGIMQTLRQVSTTLNDGTKITIGDDVYVTVRNESAFISFLEENDALDKAKYVVEVSATEHEAMKEIATILKRRGILYNIKTKMHAATEKKFWRDIILRSVKTDNEITLMEDIISKFASIFKFNKTSIRKGRKTSIGDIPF